MAVVFFDVDGTLIWHRPGKSVGEVVASSVPSPAVKRAFDELRARGHKTFICTGRCRQSVSPALMDLNPTGLITNAGGRIDMDGACLRDVSAPRDVLIGAVERTLRVGVDVMLEGSDGLVGVGRGSTADADAMGVPAVRDVEGLLRVAPSLRFCKFTFRKADAARFEPLRPWVMRNFTLVDLGISLMEACLAGVDKGVAVRTALERLGAEVEDSYAFGDSENDMPMLRAVGTSVAMGNALPQVKAVCDQVTDAVQDDGVPNGLRRLGLIG